MIKSCILILLYRISYFQVKFPSIGSEVWTGQPMIFDSPVLGGGRPASPPNKASMGFGLLEGNTHFTWTCGSRMAEDEFKTLAKRVPGQSHSSMPNWVVQTRRASGGFWEPTLGAEESYGTREDVAKSELK